MPGDALLYARAVNKPSSPPHSKYVHTIIAQARTSMDAIGNANSVSSHYEPAFDLNTNCTVLVSLLPTVIFWLVVPSFSCQAEMV